jgi:hypothetical protein
MSIEFIEVKQYTVSEYLVELMNEYGAKFGNEIAYRIEDKETGTIIVEANLGMYLENYQLIDPYIMMKAKITAIEKTTTYYEFKYGPLANNAPLKAKTDKIGYIIQIDTKKEKTATESTEEKVLIYSIEPEYIEKIANGQKTIEVRKRRLPQWAIDKIEKGDVVNGYGYCTKSRSRLAQSPIGRIFIQNKPKLGRELNGLVIVKFQITGDDEITHEQIVTDKFGLDETNYEYMTEKMREKEILEKSCLSLDKLLYYHDGRIYAHYLSNVEKIEPIKINNFYKVLSEREKSLLWEMDLPMWKRIKKAPQSFMTAYIYGGNNNG